MNFATCRNCHHCKYRGDKGWETYCELDDKGYVENNKTCPMGKINGGEFMKAEDGLREIITNWGESIVADKGLIDDLVIQILAWHKKQVEELEKLQGIGEKLRSAIKWL